MIYTVTLNPAIDKTVVIDEYQRGKVNRSINTRKDVGGKGINVSKVLKVLGIDSVCTGILGNENSNFFLNYLESLNIKSDFYLIPGENRTNIKIVEKKHRTVTDINDKGFIVTHEELKKFIDYFLSLVDERDLVVLSGSLPEGIKDSIYGDLINLLKGKSVKVILDADNNSLIEGVEAIPYAIKPNVYELKGLVDIDEKNIGSIVKAGRDLINKGIEKVLISSGREGAVYVTAKNIYFSEGLEVPIESTVGAGDAMVAGMAYGIENGLSDYEVFKLAIACGTAKVMTAGTEIPDIERIKEITSKIIVKPL